MATSNKLHLSDGNMKLGRIPSVSLPPLVTCVDNPPCATLCYARKAYEGYAAATAGLAWRDNLMFYLSDPSGYFNAIIEALARKRPQVGSEPRYFRWHVGGDIPDEAYFDGMHKVAALLPGWRFLAYTRRPWAWSADYKYTLGQMPENLRIIRSLWLTDPVDDPTHPWFKVHAKGEALPTTSTSQPCSGSCSECKLCWSLKPGHGVHIELH